MLLREHPPPLSSLPRSLPLALRLVQQTWGYDKDDYIHLVRSSIGELISPENRTNSQFCSTISPSGSSRRARLSLGHMYVMYVDICVSPQSPACLAPRLMSLRPRSGLSIRLSDQVLLVFLMCRRQLESTMVYVAWLVSGILKRQGRHRLPGEKDTTAHLPFQAHALASDLPSFPSKARSSSSLPGCRPTTTSALQVRKASTLRPEPGPSGPIASTNGVEASHFACTKSASHDKGLQRQVTHIAREFPVVQVTLENDQFARLEVLEKLLRHMG